MHGLAAFVRLGRFQLNGLTANHAQRTKGRSGLHDKTDLGSDRLSLLPKRGPVHSFVRDRTNLTPTLERGCYGALLYFFHVALTSASSRSCRPLTHVLDTAEAREKKRRMRPGTRK